MYTIYIHEWSQTNHEFWKLKQPNVNIWFYSLCTDSAIKSASRRQHSAGKEPRKTSIHPLTLSPSQKYFLPLFQDSVTLCPPALLLVHQLTSLPGAASRDLLLVCSSSTQQLGLANTGHVESRRVSSKRGSPFVVSVQMLACRRTAFDCPLWPEWRSAVSLLHPLGDVFPAHLSPHLLCQTRADLQVVGIISQSDLLTWLSNLVWTQSKREKWKYAVKYDGWGSNTFISSMHSPFPMEC